MANSGRVVRLIVEVDGYEWRVHGHQSPVAWRPHLVELLGPLECNVFVDTKLARKIRAAIAQHLDGASVGFLPPELILGTGKEQ